ncbi:MAG: 23S rRNA (pseudouridine(1915)-N(3))-methyltransferase RlmH [Bacilli bacterium]
MMKLICVGKIKERYLTEGIEDYFRRINKYHKLEIIEVDDSVPDIEEGKIIKYIDNRDYVITLEIDGNNLSSVELAEKIDKTFISNSNITFIIGGSYGLSDNIKKRSNYKLSFSRMTFPHGLFRMIFLEQLYRSFKILNNETYHK